jgi:hypothetical protein
MLRNFSQISGFEVSTLGLPPLLVRRELYCGSLFSGDAIISLCAKWKSPLHEYCFDKHALDVALAHLNFIFVRRASHHTRNYCITDRESHGIIGFLRRHGARATRIGISWFDCLEFEIQSGGGFNLEHVANHKIQSIAF